MGPADTLSTLVRDEEPERYLAALLAPEPIRHDLLAVAAFAAELRRIPGQVKDPMMGEIRLQWWRDVIASPEPILGHVTSAALHGACQRYQFAKPLLTAMTEARAFDLYADPMPDVPALQGYLDKTESAPFSLALLVVGATAPAALADHAGRAFGLTRLLAELPRWLARGRCPLPQSMLQAHGDGADDLLAGRATPSSRQIIARAAADAETNLAEAVRLARDLPRAKRVPLLPLATIRPYLRALRHQGHDPVRVLTEISPLTRVARIARAHWLGL